MPTSPRIGIEPPPPEPLADNDHAVIAFAKFALVKNAALDWLHAEEREQTRRDDRALDPLGHIAAGQVEIGEIERRDDARSCASVFPNRDIPARKQESGRDPVAENFSNRRTRLCGRLERQRADQERIDQAENGRVRGDRQRDGDGGDNGEAGRLYQVTKS